MMKLIADIIDDMIDSRLTEQMIKVIWPGPCQIKFCFLFPSLAGEGA
jgi:hypothetical protein